MRGRLSYKTRLLLALAGLAAALVVTAGVLGLSVIRSTIFDHAREALLLVSEQEAGKVEDWLLMGAEAARLTSELSSVETLDVALAPGTPVGRTVTHELRCIVRALPHVRSISLLRPDTGTVALSTKDDLLASNRSTETWFAQAKSQLVVGTADAEAAAQGLPLIVTALPVWSAAGKLNALVVVEMSTADLNHIIEKRGDFQRTAVVYVTDARGRPLTDLPRPRSALPRNPVASERGRPATEGTSGWSRYTGSSGRPVLGAYRPLSHAGLGLVAEVELGELNREVLHAWSVLGLTVAAFVILGSVVAWKASRWLSEPLEQLTTTARQLMAGQWTARVPVAGDDELAQMERAFNAMADGLQKTQEHLEDLVAVRTSELATTCETLQREVTERQRTQRELERSERRYRTLVETSFDWVWEMDDQGRLTYASPKIRDMLGYEPADVRGRTPFDLMDDEESKRVRGIVGELAAQRKPFSGLENALRHKNGNLVVVETAGVPVFTDDGYYAGYRGMVRDVTARKSLEAEKQHLEAGMRHAQKMEAIGTLAGGIAHDFNNILTPIMAHCEMAMMQVPSTEPAHSDLSHVLRAAERAAALVKQILTISRKEGTEALTPVNVGALVKEMAKFLRASIPSTIEVRTHVDTDCLPVPANPSQLHQVILNLCTNASYAMAETGGVLTVSLKMEEPAAGAESRVALTVSDTGAGIPEAILGRIFEPYFTTKPLGVGSGLGLAVVHGIVTNFGGEIRVTSSPGAGTTFAVLLPAAERRETPRHAPVENAPRGSGQRVLAVDDDESIRAVLKPLLESLGYRARLCRDGNEALDVFLKDPQGLDAVLTDHTMPGMTGITLAAKMLEVRPDLPIVLGTGIPGGPDEKLLRDAGFRGLLLKPFTAQSLGRVLQDALSSPHPSLPTAAPPDARAAPDAWA